jgi:hypothetical protein
VVERPICIFLLGRCDGVVNVTDSKSVPFGGAGSNPANVSSFCSRSSVGRSSASHAEGPGFDPLRELVCYFRGRSSVQSAQRTVF